MDRAAGELLKKRGIPYFGYARRYGPGAAKKDSSSHWGSEMRNARRAVWMKKREKKSGHIQQFFGN